MFVSTVIAAAAFSFSSLPLHTAPSPVKGFSLVSSKSRTLSPKTLAKAEKASTGGKADAGHKSILFSGTSPEIVVTTGPEKDMMSYRIRGLRNPTITMRAGATLHVLFVNTDDDMLHSFRITAKNSPFESDVKDADSVGSKQLAHKTSKSFSAQDLHFRAPAMPGTYRYLCTVAGHAAAGMFGTIVVK